jgi:hypothetical protein
MLRLPAVVERVALSGSTITRLMRAGQFPQAVKLEVGLGPLLVPAYYLLLQQTHPSVKGMLDRLAVRPDGTMQCAERLQPQVADRILCAAHALVLHALQVRKSSTSSCCGCRSWRVRPSGSDLPFRALFAPAH